MRSVQGENSIEGRQRKPNTERQFELEQKRINSLLLAVHKKTRKGFLVARPTGLEGQVSKLAMLVKNFLPELARFSKTRNMAPLVRAWTRVMQITRFGTRQYKNH